MPPPTQFARNGDTHIAYQVVGDGPFDLVVSPGFISHIDLMWEAPASRNWLERLASFARVIHYDKPGTGASDPVTRPPTLEERAADLDAVLEAAGAGDGLALLGYSEGGPASILYAARHPDRVSALVLLGTFAAGPGAQLGVPRDSSHPSWRTLPAADELDDVHREGLEAIRPMAEAIDEFVTHWGKGRSLDVFAPSIASRDGARETWGHVERSGASPGMVAALFDAVWDIDVRTVLPTLDVPTLVLHREDDRACPAIWGRTMAAAIPDARYVEHPGTDHLPWIDAELLLDDIEEFLTGTRPARTPTRYLATVLFTDVVDSTTRAAEVGDDAWRRTLETHDRVVRTQIDVHGGRTVKNLGDGHLAEFAGPAAAVRAAQEAQAKLHELDLQLRAGVHTGECERLGDDLAGIAVHIGARISELAAPDEVWVSPTVPGLVVGSGLRFEPRGTHELKGLPGEWDLHAVVG